MNTAVIRKQDATAMGREMSRDRTAASREAALVKAEPVTPVADMEGTTSRASRSVLTACRALDTRDCSLVPGRPMRTWRASGSCPLGSWKKAPWTWTGVRAQVDSDSGIPMLRDIAEGGPDLRWSVRHHVAIRVRDGHVGDEFHLR